MNEIKLDPNARVPMSATSVLAYGDSFFGRSKRGLPVYYSRGEEMQSIGGGGISMLCVQCYLHLKELFRYLRYTSANLPLVATSSQPGISGYSTYNNKNRSMKTSVTK